MTTDNIDLPLSGSQRHFGEKQITLAADRWGVTPLQAAKIMMDIAYIKDAWNWVNMDTFLDNYTAQQGAHIMTDKQANELSSCGYGCHIIGGPWISTNPSCPECNKTDEEDDD